MCKMIKPLPLECRVWLKETLDSWATTYEDEDGKEAEDAWKEIKALAKKALKRSITQGETLNIIFHLWQKFGQEDD